MIRCVIIDDEPLARDLLSSYVKKIKELELVSCCSNALDAISVLQTTNIDLLFLDIEMPQLTGIDLLRTMQGRPPVILTTAYRQYAFEAYDLDVIDYMLKPISFERFLRGIGKLRQLKSYAGREEPDAAATPILDDAYLYLKENREMVKVFLRDILYIESMRDYVRVKTVRGQVVAYQKISYLEQKLPQKKFVRIHRSFLVAVAKVTAFSPSGVRIDNHEIPIGRNYKHLALKYLSGHDLLA